MVRFIFAAALGVMLSGPMLAPAVAQDTRGAGIENTIRSQIDAFLKDDFETAFTFASPTIKRIFQSHERFGQMVRNGFPMVWRPSEVQFLELNERGGLIYQKVLLRDAGGVPFVLEYHMIETESGWQIDGVQFLEEPGVAA